MKTKNPAISDCSFRCGDCPAWDCCDAYDYNRDDWGTSCTREQMFERAMEKRKAYMTPKTSTYRIVRPTWRGNATD